jgi:hypothetical protein
MDNVDMLPASRNRYHPHSDAVGDEQVLQAYPEPLRRGDLAKQILFLHGIFTW